jgi:Omp85 superfamily domain
MNEGIAKQMVQIPRGILVTGMIVRSLFSFSQDTSAGAPYKTKVKFIPLPVVAANPTSGWMFGVAPGATWFMGEPKNTSISNALGTVIYTTKKQWIITAKANTFFKGDQWNMITDMRYFITSTPTYGLGTGPQSAKPVGTGFADYTDNPYNPIPSDQMMYFNFYRVHNTLMKRYKESRFFGGIGYHFDMHEKIDDVLLNFDTVPNTITSHYAYSVSNDFSAKAYALSGISFNFLYDSRDNAVNPYKGRYAFANIRINPSFLGSTQNSSILWLEYRDYLHLSKERPRHLIGFWTYGWFVTSGKVPYMDLPAVGWDLFGRSGRAYTQGRFRGEDVIYTELEYRVPLQRKKETFGAVIFLNGTTAANRQGNIYLYEYVDIGYGVGLRIMLDKKSRANLNIDYAFGLYGAQGFYFGINEVF